MQIPEIVTKFYKYLGEVATIESKRAFIKLRFFNTEPRLVTIVNKNPDLDSLEQVNR